MMKRVYAVMLAVVLGLATMGQSMAVTQGEAKVMDDMVQSGKLYPEILAYAQTADPDVKGYTGAQIEKLNEGFALFAGMPMPPETASVVIDTKNDDGSGVALVSLYNAQGVFIGAAGFDWSLIETVLAYAEAGV